MKIPTLRKNAVKLSLLLAAVAMLTTPAILYSQKRTAPAAPRRPADKTSSSTAAPGTTQNVQIIDDPDDPPGGGGGPNVTTSSLSVDWEIVEWHRTGHTDFMSTFHDGQLYSITITNSDGTSRTVTRAEIDALGLPAPTGFLKQGVQTNQATSSGSFTQPFPSIYGNSLTVRGTYSLH